MKKLILMLVVGFAFASCSKEELQLRNDQKLDIADVQTNTPKTNGISQAFHVRIENVVGGNTFATPFAPGLWAVQKKNSAPIFINGEPDFGEGLEALAEDGNPGELYASLNHHPKVRSRGIFNTPVGAEGPAPIFPGDAYEFVVIAKPNDHLNFATMFIQSNDLFVGPSQQGIPLFDKAGNPKSGDVTKYLDLWDAGTEVNEEPGVGPNQAPRQSGPDTGLDENGVVQVVDDEYSYPPVEDLLMVTLTPID